MAQLDISHHCVDLTLGVQGVELRFATQYCCRQSHYTFRWSASATHKSINCYHLTRSSDFLLTICGPRRLETRHEMISKTHYIHTKSKDSRPVNIAKQQNTQARSSSVILPCNSVVTHFSAHTVSCSPLSSALPVSAGVDRFISNHKHNDTPVHN